MRMAMTRALGSLLVAFLLLEPSSTAAAAGQMGERTYRQLSRAYELMEDGRYDEAHARLDKVRRWATRKPGEHARLLQSYGYLYTHQDQYREAIDSLTECLALQALPESETKQLLYLLAQLQMAVADYPAVIVSLEQWFVLEKHPTPSAFALAGSAYGHARRYDEAVTHLTKALALVEDPEETWYRQLLAVYFESQQYRPAASLLQEMITRFPGNAEYWLQLSSVYRALENDAQSIAVMELAYQQGLLTREADLLTLARYYLYRELPYRAGQLLERALQQGAVRPTNKNWGLLIDAWTRARESELALAAIERALDTTKDVNLYLRHAQVLAEKEDWQQVVVSLEAALATEGLAFPGQAHFLQGIAHYHLQEPNKAMSCFERAKAYDGSKSQAEQWIEYLTATLRVAVNADLSRDFSPLPQ
jgi:tetratricopeptide (TPR) repeat protein